VRAVRAGLLILITLLALLAEGCSSQPKTCDEAADQTVELMQDVISEVEADFADLSVDEFIDRLAIGDDLPSITALEDRADQLSERLGELGCTQEQLDEAVAARTGRLHATTPVGQFILQAMQSGEL
jgi:hypothetical protein